MQWAAGIPRCNSRVETVLPATPGAAVNVRGYVRGYTDLARIDVVRNGQVAHSVLPDLDLPRGWLAVPLRLEWGRGPGTVDWSGTLRIDGGRVLQTAYWSPEITAAGRHEVSWMASTRSFGEPYGSQRGGVEVTLIGPPEARCELRTRHAGLTTALGELAGRVTVVPTRCPGQLRIQPGTGGLVSLGSAEHRLCWADSVTGPACYYLRATQVDGELAWSSPIWVDVAPG